MKEALKEAEKAFDDGEVPVGAVIVKDGIIISRSHNMKEKLKDATAHAEMLCIRKASKVLNSWRLSGCDIYVTLEPCPMCTSSILEARIKTVHIGTFDPEKGACGSVINLAYGIEVNWEYDTECSRIIEKFFKKLRHIDKHYHKI